MLDDAKPLAIPLLQCYTFAWLFGMDMNKSQRLCFPHLFDTQDWEPRAEQSWCFISAINGGAKKSPKESVEASYGSWAMDGGVGIL